FTVNPRLETSAETLPEWAPDRAKLTLDDVGKKVNMRVELQPLHRLPRSNAIVFPVRTYFASLEELCTIPKWGRRMHRVLRDLNPEIRDYKG
ncbi:heme-dependent oxidative N-demethylase subunit alpha family protein, partial [Bacillus cereus group sp. BC87]